MSARVQLLDAHMPIANLGVHFRSADSKGRFAFTGVAPGTYILLTQKSQPGGGGELARHPRLSKPRREEAMTSR